MAKKKSRAELEAELKYFKKHVATQNWTAVAVNFLRGATVVGVAAFMYLTVKTLAGQTTIADIGVTFLADVRVSEALAWILGVSGGTYGWRQRKLRRDTIERLSDRITELEQERDPNRSSSRLTPRGDTRPEDRQ